MPTKSNPINKPKDLNKSRASSLTTSVLNVSDKADRIHFGTLPFGLPIKGASRPNKGVPVVNVNPLMEEEAVDLKRYSTTIIPTNKNGPTSTLVKAPQTNLRNESEDDDLARNCSWGK